MSTISIARENLDLAETNSSPTIPPASFEKEIKSIKAEDIDAIAQSIIERRIIQRLGIDVLEAVEIPELKTTNINGKESPVDGDQYNPKSETMKFLLPQVTKILEEAFSTPSQFLDQGITIPLFTQDRKGLLEKDDINKFLADKINTGKSRIIRDLELRSIHMEVQFQLNKEYTEKRGELYFDTFEKINGANTAHGSDSLKGYHKHLTPQKYSSSSPVYCHAELPSPWVEPTLLDDGSKMEGNFDHGTGEGKRIFKDGHIWEGHFVSWFLNGEGKHISPNGYTRKGNFKDGELNGEGEIISSHGISWKGNFKDGELNGEGEEIKPNGTSWKGNFKDGALNGIGLITYPDGKTQEALFKDHKITHLLEKV